MNDFEIVFYRRASGECPVCDFLDSLNKVMRFKMMHQMDLLELYGNHPRGDYKSSRPTSGPQWRPKLDDIMSSAESRRSPSISRDSLSCEKDR